MNFLPGEPNVGLQKVCATKWRNYSVVAYCSGNNLIILTKLLKHVQVLYFDRDLECIDVDEQSGTIVVASRNIVYVCVPDIVNVTSEKTQVQWRQCSEIAKDYWGNVRSLSWGNENELIVGTQNSLNLLFVNKSDGKYQLSVIWSSPLANECYLVKFSRNSELIACISKYDKFIKFFYRTNFDTFNTQFNLVLLKNSDYVINFKFRYINGTNRSNYNVFYSLSADKKIQVFLSFEFEKFKKIQHWGTLKLDSDVRFVNIMDNFFLDHLIICSKNRNNLQNSNIESFLKLESDLVMAVNDKNEITLYLVNNLNSSPPKPIFFKKLNFKNSIFKFSDTVIPNPDTTFVTFTDFIKIFAEDDKSSQENQKITFANYHEYKNQDEFSNKGDLMFLIHDWSNRNLYQVYLNFDVLMKDFDFDVIFGDFLSENSLVSKKRITNLSTQSEKIKSTEKVSQSKTAIELSAVLAAKLTGHNKSIQQLYKDISGESVLTVSRFNEHILWKPVNISGITLEKKCHLITSSDSKLLSASLIRSGDFVVIHTNTKLELWDTKSTSGIATKLQELEVPTNHSLLTFFHVPEHHQDQSTDMHYFVALYNDSDIYVTKAWCLNLKSHQLSEFDIEPLPVEKESFEIQCVSPVDPAGWHISLEVHTADVLTMISSTGLLKSFSIRVKKSSMCWILNQNMETDLIEPYTIKGSLINKIAVVNKQRDTIYIYNSKHKVLEYSEKFEDASLGDIRDVDWSSTTDDTNKRNAPSLFLIGFNKAVLLYSQLNFDYTNNLPAFAPVRKFDLSNSISQKINDSLWLKNGLLVMGAGNQLYVNDNQTPGTLSVSIISQDTYTKKVIGDRSLNTNKISSLFELVQILNNTLPVYHPQVLIQSIYFGKLYLVKKILLQLFLHLKEVNYNDDDQVDANFRLKNLSRSLGIAVHEFYTSWIDHKTDTFSANDEIYHLDNYDVWIPLLQEKLMRVQLPILTRHQQMTLMTVVESVPVIEKYHKLNTVNFDQNATNFLLGFKLYQSHAKTQPQLNMRDNLFGMHAQNKQLLLDFVMDSAEGQFRKLTWSKCKKAGMTYWLSEDLLTKEFDVVANNEFQLSAQSDEKVSYFEKHASMNPINATLFYLALRKKTILIKLWRICHGHPEQAKLTKFLSMDFVKVEKHRVSAAKNAFALLSKHRYYFASCFFLLADSLHDCVNVLLKKCHDIDLAVAVSRVYAHTCTDSVQKQTLLGELNDVLVSHVATQAFNRNDRWTLSCVFQFLKAQKLALRALTEPPADVLKSIKENGSEDSDGLSDKTLAKLCTSYSEYEKARAQNKDTDQSFLRLDPLLVILYRNLRAHFADVRISNEYKFVFQAALIYSRMGCDYLSVDLLRNWEFKKLSQAQEPTKDTKEVEDQFAGFVSKKKLIPVEDSVQEFSFDAFGF